MKDVFSVLTLVMGVLFFGVFLFVLKPEPLGAVTTPSKPVHCKMTASRAPGCRN